MFERNKPNRIEQKQLNPKEIFKKAGFFGAGLLTALAVTTAKPQEVQANAIETPAESNLSTPDPQQPKAPLIQTPTIDQNSEPASNSEVQAPVFTNNFNPSDFEFSPEDISIESSIKPSQLNLNPNNHLPQESNTKKEVDQTSKRLEKIKSHPVSGFSPAKDYDINSISQEYGSLGNKQEVIRDETQASIVDEGTQYDAIHTTNLQTTISESPRVEKTTYQQSHLEEETHITFEILGLQKQEDGTWTNIVGAEDGYILPDGSLNPNYPLTPEQRKQSFQDLQDGIRVDQDKVNQILQPGDSTREELQGVSKNFSAQASSQKIEDSDQKDTFNTIEPIQTITTQESSKAIRSTDQKTTVAQRTTKVSVEIEEESLQDDLAEYLSKVDRPTNFQPIIENNFNDYDFSKKESKKQKEDLNQYLSKQPTKTVKNQTDQKNAIANSDEDLSQYLSKQPSKQAKPIKNQPIHPVFHKADRFSQKLSRLAKRRNSSKAQVSSDTEKTIETNSSENKNPIPTYKVQKEKTPLHNLKLLKKLNRLKNTTSAEHQIGHKQSQITTTKNKDRGTFWEVDTGLQKQTKLEITSGSTTFSSDFVNVFRTGAENDNPEVQAAINGSPISNTNTLFGIYGGIDLRNTLYFSQFDYNYNRTHNLTAGVSYGVASKNAALAVRTSINYDLDSNEFYPQINAKGYYSKGNFAANADINLSTNPIYSNPNEANLGVSYRIPLANGNKKSITLSGSQKLGIGENHELYKDQTKLGVNLRLNKVNVGATVSPKLTENSRHGGAVYANYQDKWGSVFVEGSQHNKDKLLQVGASINLGETSSIRARYKMIKDGFHGDTEHVGTLEFNKKF